MACTVKNGFDADLFNLDRKVASVLVSIRVWNNSSSVLNNLDRKQFQYSGVYTAYKML